MCAALSAISEYIWDEKYRLKDNDGKPIDKTIEDTFSRVARSLAVNELKEQCSTWEASFYDALSNFEVLPGGRILAGVGSGRNVSAMNCFVMGTVEDSLSGIHDALKESALTMQQGGGIGTDFSTIRPAGAPVTRLGSTASGPLSFMDNWDSMCRTIMSASHRRGAMMATLIISHPDVESFIEAKRDGKRFRMFNLSVLITDKFMEAVRNDGDWELVFGGKIYKRLRARDLWYKIMRSTYEFADPGVIFIDRVNALNPLRSIETISCSNPCGEELLPPYAPCDLGSINLARLVRKPFVVCEGEERFDWSRLDHLVAVLVRMLDNVLDVTGYPLEKQKHESLSKRRIGIGITGLADALAMMGIKYSSVCGGEFTRDVVARIRKAAEQASEELGEEKGSFPLFKPEFYENKPKHRRNSHLMAIAPTGTISLFAGNVSSGIEPIFDLSLKRRILQKDNSWKEVEIKDYAWEKWQEAQSKHIGTGDLGAEFETTAQLEPIHHLRHLAAAQENIDSSVSKTINCPESISFEDFQDIYQQAYTMGAKSCTTYRPNKITGSILSSDTMTAEKGSSDMGNVVELSKPLVRPEQLIGSTYRLKPTNLEHALFITINDVEVNNVRRPYEIFINTKNLEFISWTTALTVMISAIFRKGGDVSFVGGELRAIFDPRGGYWEGKSYVPSVIAGIGRVIEDHVASLCGRASKTEPKKACPACQTELVQKEGCWSCTSCTYSACG